MKKILAALIFLALFILDNAFAQLYAPEIKVQETTNNQIEMGDPTTESYLKVFGRINAQGVTIGNYGSELAGDPSPYFINSEANIGNRDLTLYGPSSGSTLHLRLFDGSLKFGQAATPNAVITNDGIAEFKKLVVGNFGDNSFMDFEAANNKKASIGMQDDGSDGLYFSVNGSYMMHINENGRVGIGLFNTSPHRLNVAGSIASNGMALTSDQRLKKDIQDYSSGLALVEQMKVKKYKYKKPKKKETEHNELPSEENENDENIVEEDPFYEQEQIGILAQDIQKIAPNLVESFKDEDGEETLTINFTAFTFILVNAVKEQQQEIESLENRIQALEKLLQKKE